MASSESYICFDKCRLCSEETGVQNVYEVKDLVQNIKIIIGVKLSLTDNLPHKIGLNCLNTIKQVVQLKEIATKNELLLKQLAKEVKPIVFPYEDLMNVTPEVISLEIENSDSDSDVIKNTRQKSKLRVRKDLMEAVVAPAPVDNEDAVTNGKSRQSSVIVTSSAIIKSNGDVKDVDTKPSIKDPDKLICQICNKKFMKWKQLYLHERMHTKKFVCPLHECEKKFASKNDLEKHVRVHTGEKPYHCKVCDRKFSQRGSLKQHNKNVHNFMYS